MHRDLSQDTWPPKHLPAKYTERSHRRGPSGSPHPWDTRQIGLSSPTGREQGRSGCWGRLLMKEVPDDEGQRLSRNLPVEEEAQPFKQLFVFLQGLLLLPPRIHLLSGLLLRAKHSASSLPSPSLHGGAPGCCPHPPACPPAPTLHSPSLHPATRCAAEPPRQALTPSTGNSSISTSSSWAGATTRTRLALRADSFCSRRPRRRKRQARRGNPPRAGTDSLLRPAQRGDQALLLSPCTTSAPHQEGSM